MFEVVVQRVPPLARRVRRGTAHDELEEYPSAAGVRGDVLRSIDGLAQHQQPCAAHCVLHHASHWCSLRSLRLQSNTYSTNNMRTLREALQRPQKQYWVAELASVRKTLERSSQRD